MRKTLLILLLSCLHIAARGQTMASLDDLDLSGLPQPTTAKALRYWIDDDAGSVKTVGLQSGHHTLDVSTLTEGLHTLHYQVVDNTNAVCPAMSAVFLKAGTIAAGTSARQLRYWFDDDASTVKTVSAASGVQTVDAARLVEGLHTLHCQVVGADGALYSVASGLFLKMSDNSGAETVTARTLMYWFDDESNVKTADVSQGTQMLDASSLVEGLHTIHYQVLCSNGQMTSAMSSVFLRVTVDAENTTAKSLRYWFDNEQSATVTSIVGGVQLLDAARLVEGLHTLHYQVVDNKGQLGPSASSVFLKMGAQTEASQAKSIRYWLDSDTTPKIVDVSKGTQTLDVSDLLSGIHTLYYQIIDSNGKVGPAVSAIFMKGFDKAIAGGENRITQYQYWLNDHSQAMETVTLSKAANPYTLISLLPMQKEPVRSQLFHFEVTDGVPTVYAKNEFHIRFHDAAGYFSDDFRPFIDYSVKQAVNAEWLESGVYTETAKPTENTIKWYCLTAEPGDSVQFRLDRAATLQLFTPSGEEVFSAFGADVVNWCGCHTRETGTYYLALHDVTAEYGNTIGIEYEHIDKYAVLRQDVSVVGNGGCSTITFEGNGFRDLYAVSLVNEQGDSIHHVYIGHESDATTSVVFDFTDAALGQYDAVFRFAEEDKVFDGLVTVEEAENIELATTVTYPSTFLQGTSITFSIKIENKGNMTAYAVPVEIQLLTQSMDAISEIDLSENAPSLDFSWANENDIPSDSIQVLLDYIRSKGDMLHFINAYDSIDGRYFKDAHFAVEIAPHSTYVLTVTIKSSESVELQALTPSSWSSCTSVYDEAYNTARLSRRVSKEGMCCVREKVECVMNVIVGIFDFASIFPQAKLAACIASLGNTTLQFAYDVWCGEEMGGKNPRKAAEDLVWDAINGLIGCLIPGGEKWQMLSNLQWVYQHIYDNISTTMDCVKALTEEVPNCPPDPGGGGGSSSPVASMDPNDIYGYTAESGSHAVKDGLTDVYYRIEFENDTAFATAPAHDIWLTDTLDASKFDLSSFAPTRIKIGEKQAELTGEKNFVQTVDLRPAVNAIAQVEGTYDQKKGIARWHISSLDPMTMEPTKYVQDGVLPVNTDGRGIGELSFDIKMKPNLTHGTEVKNRAGIVFDANDVIMTPTWTNTIDRVLPESHVTDVAVKTDSTAVVTVSGSDEGSGSWRYDVYVQYGEGAAWWKAAENVPADTTATVKIYSGIKTAFCSVLTDMAGNVEAKEMHSEMSIYVGGLKGDVNGDRQVGIGDIIAITNFMAGNSGGITLSKADVNGDGDVGIGDIIAITNIMAGRSTTE